MKSVEEIVRDSLPTLNVLQLATSVDNQPWACNLHFYSDDDLNIYWLSTPDTRHSKEITQNSHVCAVLKVHENTLEEDYVIGISIEGTAEIVEDEHEKKSIARDYQAKLGTSDKFINSVLDGTNPHIFYKLTSKKLALFDNKNFPDEPRQEVNL